MSEFALQMQHITKAYREGFVAIHDANLEVRKGEIHGLLGENGAGKSTFVKLLSGVLPPDEGVILLEDKPYAVKTPAEAAQLGVFKLQKRSDLVPSLTVAENICLGKGEGFLFDKEQAVKTTQALINQFGIVLDPNQLAVRLNEEDALETELLKAVHQGVKLLIIDEPSSHISMAQVEYLFTMLRKLKDAGITILYVTNHEKEVMHICDRVTIMRDGTTQDPVEVAATTATELRRGITSERAIKPLLKSPFRPQDTVLKVRNLATYHTPGLTALTDINFSVREGEILAVLGNASSGTHTLCEAIAGLGHIVGGQIAVYDDDVTKDGVQGTRALGVSFLIAASHRTGVANTLSIQENLLPYQYSNPEYLNEGLLDNDKLAQEAQHLLEEYQIDYDDVNDLASTLSSASKQKLLFARECSNEPVLLIAYRPTAGTSGANASLLRQKLLELRREGTAILLVPTDAEEYRLLADSSLVLHQGRQTACCQGKPEQEILDQYISGELCMTREEMEAMCFE